MSNYALFKGKNEKVQFFARTQFIKIHHAQILLLFTQIH